MTKDIVLSNVMTFCDCGMLYATGFQSMTPVSERDERYDVPEHIDMDLSVWYVLNTSCTCGSKFFYRMKLPSPHLEEAIEEDDVVSWGDYK